MSADTNTRTPWTPWLVRGGVSRMEHTHSQPALQFACGSARAPDGPTTNSAETVAIVAQGRFEHITERCWRGNCMACRLFIAVVARGKSLVYKIEPWRAVRPSLDLKVWWPVCVRIGTKTFVLLLLWMGIAQQSDTTAFPSSIMSGKSDIARLRPGDNEGIAKTARTPK